MNNHQKNYIANIFISPDMISSDLYKVSDQIKANIAVTLLKHKLKNYISDIN